MPLSFSNIAWLSDEDEQAYSVLIEEGFSGIEVAPTRFWPDWKMNGACSAEQARKVLEGAGLCCPALQSLFYGVRDISVFGGREMQLRMLSHLEHVANIAQLLGAKYLVFGAPSLRDKGALGRDEANRIAEGFFREAAERLLPVGVCLCLEPNPIQYGCNFITTASEGAELVRRVNSPAFRLHLDVGGMYLAGDDAQAAIETCADVLAHVHASEPNLGEFEHPVADHAGAARALSNIGWNEWVSVEMKAVSPCLFHVKTAAQRVSHFYRELL